MDDLAGLNWVPGSGDSKQKAAGGPQPSYYPPLRPTTQSPSISGRSTPQLGGNPGALNGRSTTPQATSRSSTPANDSFSSLVAFGSNKSSNSPSLLERQRRLAEEKERAKAEERAKAAAQFNVSDSRFWDNLGKSNASTPSSNGGHPNAGASTVQSGTNGEDDLLAAFSAAAPVDRSTRFEPPSEPVTTDAKGKAPAVLTDDAEDPFGLGFAAVDDSKEDGGRGVRSAEDNLLGFPDRYAPAPGPAKPSSSASINGEAQADFDGAEQENQAVAELVDMGFPAERAMEALAQTPTGLDVQAAVGWLLDAAHREAKQKSSQRSGASRVADVEGGDGAVEGIKPAWMTGKGPSMGRRSPDDRAAARTDADIAKAASEIGNTLFKSANTIWKTGKKKVQKAVTELQQEGDPSQPKWMADSRGSSAAQPGREDVPDVVVAERQVSEPSSTSQEATARARQEQVSVTEEALMLEGDRVRPKPASSERPQRASSVLATTVDSPRERTSPFSDISEREPVRLQQRSARTIGGSLATGSRQRLDKAAVDEQNAQAYVSPARRRKPAQKPPAPKGPSLESSQALPKATLSARQSQSTSSQQPRTAPPAPPKPRLPKRTVPPVSAAVLSSSASDRHKGSESFKRGDYSAAQLSYSRALAGLPADHPVTIVVLCNRGLVNLKNGDPRAALADSDAALATIGPSKGEGETINLSGGDGEKDMREFYGKALARRAEALEQMEKWDDAARTWREAVEAGVGGATSIQGRDRCEKAADGTGTSSQTPVSQRPAPTRQRGSQPSKPRAAATPGLTPATAATSRARSSEAVHKLRQAHIAAEQVDDEKFALADVVDGKLAAWKAGKQDNIRALLCSLDTVLWPEAGWKKVGMHELVIATKVKIVYMKGIAKVHPDKIPISATTEQRMISAAVFAILNEAWDKFRTENNL